MSSMQFPSGPWIGFFNYSAGGRRYRMDLSLSFENGRMSGDGTDAVGPFVIAGSYDGDSGECHWRKCYLGAHIVHYRGFREGKGIWGLWELDGGSGGFHIWPLGAGSLPVESEEAEDWDLPVIPVEESELLTIGAPEKRGRRDIDRLPANAEDPPPIPGRGPTWPASRQYGRVMRTGRPCWPDSARRPG